MFWQKILWVIISFPKVLFLRICHGRRARINYLVHIERLARITIKKGTGIIMISHGSHFKSGTELHISGDGCLSIGSHVCVNSNCYIAAQQSVQIGDGCELGQNVIIVDHDHDFRAKGGIRAGEYKLTPIVIGNNVWVGANTVILRGTNIGDNCVIGAGCVISGTYLPNTVIVQKREEIKKIYESVSHG